MEESVAGTEWGKSLLQWEGGRCRSEFLAIGYPFRRRGGSIPGWVRHVPAGELEHLLLGIPSTF
ncbi:hypothetical protein LINPERHAP2_LOCUS13930 [Linum perenne]